MIVKHQIPFPENFHNLPHVQGFVIDRGEYQGQPYTALWSEDVESSLPAYFWGKKLPEGFLAGFLEGLMAAEGEASQAKLVAYSEGRAVGISLVQSGFAMVFGESGRNYVQQIVNEMGRDNIQ